MGRLTRLLAAAALVGGAWILLRELLEPDRDESERPAPPEPAAPPAAPQAAERPPTPGSASIDPSKASKAELYEEAKRLGIRGRSKMSKRELAAAIAEAS